jgi:hypothetical protein
MKRLEIEDIKVGDKFICTETQLDFLLDERIRKGKVYEIVEIDEENEEVQLNNGEYECWTSIREYLNPFEADQNVKTEETIKVSWELVYDEIQNYLIGEHGSPTMGEPYRDLSGNLVFEDCDGHGFDLDGLVEWYGVLVEDGMIEDELELLEGNIEVVDDGKI